MTSGLPARTPPTSGIIGLTYVLRRAKKAVSHGLFLATTIGGVAVTALLLWTAPILELFGASGELLAPAMAYTKIRALAIPAMIAIIVCQGASLGQQDASTPFKAALSAGIGEPLDAPARSSPAIPCPRHAPPVTSLPPQPPPPAVNVIGDAILVPHISIVGAAVATVAAQWGAALGFVWHMMRRDPAGDKVPLRWMGLPTAADLQPFWDIATAVVSRNILIMTAYTLMTKTASSMGVIPLATHQIALTVFWLISVAVEPINMAAQTLIARDISLPHLLRPLAFSLLRVGATMGLILALVCSGEHLLAALVSCPMH